MSNTTSYNYKDIALEFTQALANRDYSKAYAITSKEYQSQITINAMKNSFEEIVPADWGTMGPIEIVETMTDWPDKKPSDLGWVYVSIGGDVYSEAVTTIVTLEGETPKIREIEYGRP
ncbi:MAG: hypothetical protein BMS9Abin26_0677 [Gammaproteobacteria bacterium]|nr:MAG: hypothetical protein BMS9Abin26_0677 [Gammaproteobacteria bacterium]